MSDLFDNCENITSSEFKIMLDNTNEMAQESKSFCEKLWEKFEPYADGHFLSEIKSDEKFQDRFWEMHLGNVLLEKGFNISSENKGPDFKTDLNGQIIWIEAITASNGKKNKEDSLKKRILDENFHVINEEKVSLRLANAISIKNQKIKNYLKKSIIKDNECVIIAINTSKINDIRFARLEEYSKKILFSFSNSFILDESNKYVRITKSHITKKNGSEVNSNIFLDTTYENIGGILFSASSYSNYPEELNNKYFLVSNPFAKNKLPKEIFSIAKRVLFYESDELIKLFKKDEK